MSPVATFFAASTFQSPNRHLRAPPRLAVRSGAKKGHVADTLWRITFGVRQFHPLTFYPDRILIYIN
jgi:hypothetical protein